MQGPAEQGFRFGVGLGLWIQLTDDGTKAIVLRPGVAVAGVQHELKSSHGHSGSLCERVRGGGLLCKQLAQPNLCEYTHDSL